MFHQKLLLSLTLILALLVTKAWGSELTPKKSSATKAVEEKTTPFDFNHKAWAAVLKEAVSGNKNGKQVHYPRIKKDPSQLNSYLSQLSSVSKEEFENWSKDDQLAFWINAYNAFTIKLIVDNYPVKSIKDIGGLFSSPWKKRFFTLLGKERHLDEIEHGIIRKQFKEPRIHFAVNCASIGCPPLRTEPYVGARLNQQLDEQTRMFLADPSRNKVDLEKKVIYLSKIFDWFDDDFEGKDGSVKSFVLPYLKESHPDRNFKDFKVKYLDYDWGLNEA